MFQVLREMRTEGLQNARKEIVKLQAANVEPSFSADIWSENGIALLGMLVHFIDEEFVLREMVLRASPMSTLAHSGANIKDLSKTSCAAVGLGQYVKDSEGIVTVDTVPSNVFKAITDGASSMVAAFSDQEGSECVTHTLALVVNTVYKEGVNEFLFILDRKMRGAAAHFRHSVVGWQLLSQIMKRFGHTPRKPPTKVCIEPPHAFLE
jgi:hypothetical protein